MTDIMAALGLVQLDRYPGLLARRREIIGKYDAACDELGIMHLNHYSDHHNSSGHLYIIRIPGYDHEARCEFIRKMAEKGVACNVHYKPLPMMTAYKDLGWNIADFPNAYKLYENAVSLPLHTKLSNEDVDYVIECLKECYKKV